jgi:hypothetical protein
MFPPLAIRAGIIDNDRVNARTPTLTKEVIHCLMVLPAEVRYGQAIAVRGADLRTESQHLRRPIGV